MLAFASRFALFPTQRTQTVLKSAPRPAICMVAKSERPDNGRNELELNWLFQDRKNRKPVDCANCKGTGKVECRWCNSTGVLMLGDMLLCSVDGNCNCLNCDDGEVECKKCKGLGRIAGWLQ